MSTYTTQLRYICEVYAGKTESVGYSETPAVIAAARPKIFDFSYPLYDPDYKTALETKIINHYYLREIGAETVSQFKFMLGRTMNEIMPYYNQLYKSAELEYNPFHDVDYFKEHSGSDSKERRQQSSGQHSTTGSETGSSSDKSVFDGTTQTNTRGTRDTDIDNTAKTTLNTTDTRTLNTTDTKTLNTSDEKTLDTSNTTTHNTTDQKTLNTTDTKTLGTKDTQRRSDTPQGALTGIEANNYLTEATITDKTGTEALARTGTETGTKTGTETTAQGGTETMARTGTETTARTGTETMARTGSDTTKTDEKQHATEQSNALQTAGSTTTDTGSTSKSSKQIGSESGSISDDISGTDQYLDHIYGKVGTASFAGMLKEYRETLINIDMMIINDLEVCFMNLF